MSALRIAALGGGHGLYATLTAMRYLSPHVTAIVTVADDGGSSGRLRSELGVIPPGDLRMAMAALMCAPAALDGLAGRRDPDADRRHHELWAETLQHRFGGYGALAGHPVGNLLLAGLTEVLGDPVAALDEMMRVFDVDGRVLPMSSVPLEIEADVSGLESDPRISRVIRGQVAVATTPGKVRRVRLLPAEPPVCEPVITAVDEADLVVLGPGSWFSSVIPHVLVPDLLEALQRSTSRKVLIVNLAPEPGRPRGSRWNDICMCCTPTPTRSRSIMWSSTSRRCPPGGSASTSRGPPGCSARAWRSVISPFPAATSTTRRKWPA